MRLYPAPGSLATAAGRGSWLCPPFDLAPAAAAATVYPNLVEALAAFLAADPQTAAAFASVSNGAADRDAPLPLLAFVKAESKTIARVIGFGSRRVEHVTVHFHSVAEGADAAERLGTLVKARLLPSTAYSPAPLLFADGSECGRFAPGPEPTTLDTERSWNNHEIFINLVPVTWTVARG